MGAIGVSRRCTGSRRSNALGHQRSVRGSRSVLVVNNVHFPDHRAEFDPNRAPRPVFRSASRGHWSAWFSLEPLRDK